MSLDNNDPLKQLLHDVRDILYVLKGNELDKNDNGLLGDFQELKKEVKELREFKNKALWVIYGATFTAGYGVFELISKVFAK